MNQWRSVKEDKADKILLHVAREVLDTSCNSLTKWRKYEWIDGDWVAWNPIAKVSNLILRVDDLIRRWSCSGLLRKWSLRPYAARQSGTNVEAENTVFNLVAHAPGPRASVAPEKVENQFPVGGEVWVQSAADGWVRRQSTEANETS
jgi:hypothetical protein